MINPQLRDKVALITGANHGIGAATAIAFAIHGAKVFINYLRLNTEGKTRKADEDNPGEELYLAKQAQSADHVVEEIEKNGGKAQAWEADLANPDNIPKLFDRAEKAFGPVEILVNNAAHFTADSFISKNNKESNHRSVSGFAMQAITSEIIEKHFAVNTRAVALMKSPRVQQPRQPTASRGAPRHIMSAWCKPQYGINIAWEPVVFTRRWLITGSSYLFRS